jgi:hypothetical protein
LRQVSDFDDIRPVFEEGEQRFGTAPKFADDARGFKKIGEFFSGDHPFGRRVAFVKDIGDRRETAVELCPGRLRLGVGHQPLAGVGNVADAGNGHRA